MPEKTYHPTTQHSTSFYHLTILTLIEGLNQKLSDRQIAALLTERGLLSPSGAKWTPTAITQLLYKVRNYRTVKSKIHSALLQLVFDGILTKPEVQILFAPRRPVPNIM
ncbi:hypothetical protein UB46_16465 [Burkholderiaceae bacterium 16]|nr:hypothetical protein UB46_16465 [Burkholderiaceae bacterium 16]